MKQKRCEHFLISDKFIKVLSARCPEIIERLVCLILDIDYEKAKVEFLNPELLPTEIEEYFKTLDFNIRINDNIVVNLEINNDRFNNVKGRNYVYLSKVITGLLKEGDNPNSINKYQIYQININGNKKDIKRGRREALNIYTDNNKKYMKNIKIITISLAYYKNLLYTEYEKLNKKEKIYACLLSESVDELGNILNGEIDENLRKKIIKEVKDIKMNIKFTRQEIKGLENLQIAEHEIKAEKKGYKKGIKQGIEQGAVQSKREIAQSMLKENLSLDLINKITGLSMETIKNMML